MSCTPKVSSPRRSDYALVLSLGAAGALSGLLSILLPLSMFSLGAWLGLTVSAFLWAFRGFRSVGRSIGFAAASAVAFVIAQYASILTPIHIQSLDFSAGKAMEIHTDVFFTGGIAGGFLVFLAAFLLLCPGKAMWRKPLDALFWALPCGLLGVGAWALGPVIGGAIRSHLEPLGAPLAPGTDPQAPYYCSLLLVWQMGAGLLLGFALALEEENLNTAFSLTPSDEQDAQIRRNFSFAAKLLLVVCGALIVASYLRWILPQMYHASQKHQIRARYLAQAPPLQSLPAIKSAPVDEVLVLHDVAGCSPAPFPYSRTNPATAARPATISYTVAYSPKSTVKTYYLPPVSIVEVRQYPNAAWAQFDLRDMPFARVDADHAPPALLFGNRVLKAQLAQTGDSFYYWVSGAQMVILDFEKNNPDPDSFVREYLGKYPSSL